MATESGPFVQAACFYENVIEDKTGVYWFWIYFDDTLLSKIPFQIMYSRIVT